MTLVQVKNACIVEEYESLPPDVVFMKSFEDKVFDTMKRFNLISSSDKVLVAVSGGKDSTVLLSLLKKFGFNVEAITIDVHIGCYTKKNLENIQKFCDGLGVKLNVFEFRKEYGYSVCYITSVLKEKGAGLGTCTVCGVLRRRLLNQTARSIGASKIAFGHNRDDEVQSFFMNVMKNRHELNARLGPRPGVVGDDLFVRRVKPLFFCAEEDIAKYSKMCSFPVAYARCPCSPESTRGCIRAFLDGAESLFPNARQHLADFLVEIQPRLLEQFANKSPVRVCKKCREPTSQEVCRSCNIITTLHSSPIAPEPEDFTLKAGFLVDDGDHDSL